MYPEGTYIDQELTTLYLKILMIILQRHYFNQISVDIQANVLSDGDLDSLEGCRS